MKKLENKFEDNSENLADLASIRGALNVVEKIIPSVNKLLEDNILLLSEGLTQIASESKKMQKYLSENSTPDKNLLEAFSKRINDGASQAIVGIQFQDRVSQNLVIACDIASNLDNFIAGKYSLLEGNLNKDLSKDIMNLIKLGEIRDNYLEILKSLKLINDPSEVGFVPNSQADKVSSDDVELF
ncbi:MAG: hypothetical protein SFT90_01670 [Rickettsiales bacterium]|nr:hypothetical protein [Rickettsiales bacterium]